MKVLRRLCEDLYNASQVALDNNDFDDAIFLQSQADKLFEEAINLEYIIAEQEEQ
ncbi:hypothetical protein RIVM261_075070 [Rivularia sp. IAM M-261]|nr:hypothetical protein CAL7716_039500 [Calothrix sp. PCC 7716]GJD22551.1 hypothetical protein RIVM261_075070 [Rivularia sp. IAM M-261]